MTGHPKPMPPWDEVLSAAARLQQIVPGAVVVGGTAAAMHAGHRFSRDADHVVPDLRDRFDEILGHLESVAGWKTSRIKKPIIILASLDGIETGVRQLVRTAPLETERRVVDGTTLTVEFPTPGEILRIKAFLIVKRNAVRDFIDTAALATHLGHEAAARELRSLDSLYPQPNGASVVQTLLAQIADPKPGDIEDNDLSRYKGLAPEWHDFSRVAASLRGLAAAILLDQTRERHRRHDDGIREGARPTWHGHNQNDHVRTAQDAIGAISWFQPGAIAGRVQFDWDEVTEDERRRRLALIDKDPENSKNLLLNEWRRREPEAFAAWEARGRKPRAAVRGRSQDDKGYDPF